MSRHIEYIKQNNVTTLSGALQWDIFWADVAVGKTERDTARVELKSVYTKLDKAKCAVDCEMLNVVSFSGVSGGGNIPPMLRAEDGYGGAGGCGQEGGADFLEGSEIVGRGGETRGGIGIEGG